MVCVLFLKYFKNFKHFPKKKCSETDITTGQYYMGRIHLCYSVFQSTLCWSGSWWGRPQNESESHKTDTNLTLSEWGNGRKDKGKSCGNNSMESSARPWGGGGGESLEPKFPIRGLLSPKNRPVWVTLPCALLKAAHGKHGLSANGIVDLRAR